MRLFYQGIHSYKFCRRGNLHGRHEMTLDYRLQITDLAHTFGLELKKKKAALAGSLSIIFLRGLLHHNQTGSRLIAHSQLHLVYTCSQISYVQKVRVCAGRAGELLRTYHTTGLVDYACCEHIRY